MNVETKVAVCGRCWIGWAAVLLSACAHDPAPKARCHGPWIWITPAGPADGNAWRQGGSEDAKKPFLINAPAQPAAAGPR